MMKAERNPRKAIQKRKPIYPLSTSEIQLDGSACLSTKSKMKPGKEAAQQVKGTRCRFLTRRKDWGKKDRVVKNVSCVAKEQEKKTKKKKGTGSQLGFVELNSCVEPAPSWNGKIKEEFLASIFVR